MPCSIRGVGADESADRHPEVDPKGRHETSSFALVIYLCRLSKDSSPDKSLDDPVHRFAEPGPWPKKEGLRKE